MAFDRQPTLRSERLTLRPLEAADEDALCAVASDPALWEQHPDRERYRSDVFAAYFAVQLASGGALVVVNNKTGEIIGMSRYDGYDAERSEVEIGWTFLARRYWGGPTNKELKRLMLEHAFASVNTVLFLVGPANGRSRRAVEKLGAVEVGTRPDGAGRESIAYALARSGRAGG